MAQTKVESLVSRGVESPRNICTSLKQPEIWNRTKSITHRLASGQIQKQDTIIHELEKEERVQESLKSPIKEMGSQEDYMATHIRRGESLKIRK
jgi:hypothetical protein